MQTASPRGRLDRTDSRRQGRVGASESRLEAKSARRSPLRVTPSPGRSPGVLLAVARISGETAPLLFTALNYNFWKTSLQGPMPNLTVTIYNYAMSPFENWQQLAWGGALLITVSVLLLTVLARFCVRGRKGS